MKSISRVRNDGHSPETENKKSDVFLLKDTFLKLINVKKDSKALTKTQKKKNFNKCLKKVGLLSNLFLNIT